MVFKLKSEREQLRLQMSTRMLVPRTVAEAAVAVAFELSTSNFADGGSGFMLCGCLLMAFSLLK